MSTACRRTLAGVAIACVAGIAPLMAAGPVDGEIGAFYWAHTHETTSSAGTSSSDGDAPGFRAEIWMFDKYGVRAGQFSSDTDDVGTDGADYTSVDLMWRALNPTPNNYLAVGLGWQQMGLESVGLDGDTSGVRVSAEGRIGLPGPFHAYGLGSYLPSMDDAAATNPANGTFQDLKGMEYEMGFGWKVLPFISVRAGYRAASFDFTQNMDLQNPTGKGAPRGGSNGGGLVGLAPVPPAPEGCNCAAAITSYDGSADSDGYFLGLTMSF